ncbi:cell division protein FtsQ/DivIB [Enterococcus sp. LJL99]
MSKKKNDAESTDEQQEQKDDSLDTSSLTPWQKENLEYLKSQGDSPSWQPSLIENETTETEEKETSEEANENELDEEKIESKKEINERKEKTKQTYESFADRLPNIKKERNKRLHRRLTLIISVFVVAILIVLYYISPLSKLGNITVSGVESVDENQVIAQSKLEKNVSLWEQFWDRKIYEKNIVRRLPRVKSASISLSGLNSFKINVKEHKVVAMESSEGTYHPILENGKILTEVESSPQSDMPVFQNFSDETIIKQLITSYNKLPDDIKNNISEIRYEPSKSNKDLINLYMKDANKVIVNIDQLSEKMAYYQQVASQMTEPGVIDMEVGIFSYPLEKKETNEDVEENSEESQENL